MKNIIIAFAVMVSLASCVSQYAPIGQINMVSNRNLSENAKYELLQKYAGSSREVLMWSKARSITEAIDNVVAGVPGGEYLMNARIYKVGNNFYGAEGDVWGIAGQTDINGFKPGGVAYFKIGAKSQKVKVLSFADRRRINVLLENGSVRVVDRSKLMASNE